MPRLSILVPSRGPAELLERTLVSVLEHRPEECEVLVADMFGYADPYDLAAEGLVRFLPLPRRTCPLEALNQAVRHSQGDLLHVLAAGMEVSPGWTDAALERFEESPTLGCVAPLILDGTRSETLLAAGLEISGSGEPVWRGAQARLADRWQRPGTPLGCILPAGFYRREALPKPRAFDPRFGLKAADAALAVRLKQAGWQAVFEPRSQVTLTAAPQPSWGEAVSGGRGRERFFWHQWRKSPGVCRLVLHPFSLLWTSLAGPRPAATLLGRLWGSLDAVWPIREGSETVPPPPQPEGDHREGLHRGPSSPDHIRTVTAQARREHPVSRAA